MHVVSRVFLVLLAAGISLAFVASLSGRGAAWDESAIAIVPMTVGFLVFWFLARAFPPKKIRGDGHAVSAWKKSAGVLTGILGIVFFAGVGMASGFATMARRDDTLGEASRKREENRRNREEYYRRSRFQDNDPYAPSMPVPEYRSNDDGSLEEGYARDDETGIALSFGFAALALIPFIGLIVAVTRKVVPPQPQQGAPGMVGYAPPGYPGAYPQQGQAPQMAQGPQGQYPAQYPPPGYPPQG